MVLNIEGKNLSSIDNLNGGIRIQRVPPTEKRGRVHTSTVTIAVLQEKKNFDSNLEMRSDKDFRIDWFSGTGKGGQHRNKSQNSCRVTHIPTGMTETRQSRSRENNMTQAIDALNSKLDSMGNENIHSSMSKDKKKKVGSGMRGDKFITIQFQNDRVTNHDNGKQCTATQFMKGKLELIW